MNSIVAIVGRPNVGKSTLFNRLVGMRKAIMDNEAGITRDRHYGESEWNGKFFTVVDTGGYVADDEEIFNEGIREQINIALEEAAVVLFMVDANDGITDHDKDFANVLRRSDKPVYLVVNKADDATKQMGAAEFYAMGFDNLYAVSSQSGSGTGELLDEVVTHFKDAGTENPYEGVPKLAILGRPNVGKSSLLNALTGKDRSIVTDIAGTTRDAINTRYKMFGKDFLLIDTAGIRRKSKVKENVEFYSVMRSVKALDEADVCIIMIDATQGVEGQDLNIIRLAQNRKKGIMVLMNKWDLVDKETMTSKKIEEEIREKLAPNHYIPIIFISALTKQRIHKAIEKAMEIYENKTSKIATSKLNDTLLPEIERYPPPSYRGKHIKIKYITQLPTNTPTIAFFTNFPNHIKESYKRFLENKFRAAFGFEGVPVNFVFRKK